MKIRTETVYIAQYGGKEQIIKYGEYATLVFEDGSYHSGDIIEITDRVITIERGDGGHTYSLLNIKEIRQ